MVDLNTDTVPYIEPEIGEIDTFYGGSGSIGISGLGNVQINVD